MTPHSSILQHAAVRAYFTRQPLFCRSGRPGAESAYLKKRDARVICVGQDAREASPRLLGLEEDEQLQHQHFSMDHVDNGNDHVIQSAL